jgi:hypothetical protein
MKAVTLSAIETRVFCGTVQSAYKRSECSDRISSEGSYESVVSWRSESRRIFSSKVPE